MIDYIHAAAYVGVISILLLLGPLCYLDIRYRKLPWWPFWLLGCFNIPALTIIYYNGLPFIYIAFSILLTIFFFALYFFGAYKGGDANLLICISWFCPLNPLNPTDNFFQMQYVIFLAGVSILWMIYVYFRNRHSLDPVAMKSKTLWRKFNDHPRGSPWMIPISVAFILAVIFG